MQPILFRRLLWPLVGLQFLLGRANSVKTLPVQQRIMQDEAQAFKQDLAAMAHYGMSAQLPRCGLGTQSRLIVDLSPSHPESRLCIP